MLSDNLYSLNLYIRDPSNNNIVIAAAGDTGIFGKAKQTFINHGVGFLTKNISPIFLNSDLAFCNLESPFTNKNSSNIFVSPAFTISELKFAGLNLLNIANNHILEDSGLYYYDTIDLLSKAGFLIIGENIPQSSTYPILKTEVNGVVIGWISCANTGIPNQQLICELNFEKLINSIKENINDYDIIIVSLHTGYMFVDYPSPELRKFSKILIDSGAKLILIHHPHILQGIEVINEKVICYSLGNFLFDWRQGLVKSDIAIKHQREGGIFLFQMDKYGLCTITIIPIFLDDNCKVHWAVGSHGINILNRLKTISINLNNISYSKRFYSQYLKRLSVYYLDAIISYSKQKNWNAIIRLLGSLKMRHLKYIINWLYNLF